MRHRRDDSQHVPESTTPPNPGRHQTAWPRAISDRAPRRYLCAGGRDMTTGTGLWQSVLSYNNTSEYAQLVYGAAQRYSQASLRG